LYRVHAAAGRAVRLRHNEHHLLTGPQQRIESTFGELGCAREDQTHQRGLGLSARTRRGGCRGEGLRTPATV
jgi:hypothetical protein